MGKKNKGGNGPKKRQERREQKRRKIEREFRKNLERKARQTMIVGPDGKTPMKSNVPMNSYRAGGLRFEIGLVPDQLLNKALAGAQQMIGGQAYAAAMKKSGSAVVAQNEGNTAAAAVQDPFIMEPCAMAVFMYLSRELEYRDRLIEQLNERLVMLGAEPLDVEHPYPVPEEPDPVEEASEEELASQFVPGAPAGESAEPSQDA